ncbi:CBS domain-containing protein [Kitasatospora sp. MAP12-15]|uniref:CBS domain-containing protein n=1 Tax=unclassified Kitasatospora TaxID=2633591 RepID=UPI002474E40F|nr:CBS domain-containing protein [Kitasatospora sp. MAP12-44]MDH6108420.1 CBS domain-containing protein [Kitasatospora sp. MAP12-44]
MQHRTVHDVMTQGVVTARPDTPFKEVAGLFHRNDVTAVPVVDDRDRPLGMVSEMDLLRSEALQPDPAGHGASAQSSPDERPRAEAATAGALMTSPAVSARPEWSIVEAARVMDRKRVKRMPVVDETGRLVGIVSRSDLLRLFLRHDAAIHEEIIHDVIGETLWLTPTAVQVAVHEGVVTLAGRVEQKSLIPVVERLCRSVDGVVAVHHTLGYTVDDTGTDLGEPLTHGTVGPFTSHR